MNMKPHGTPTSNVTTTAMGSLKEEHDKTLLTLASSASNPTKDFVPNSRNLWDFGSPSSSNPRRRRNTQTNNNTTLLPTKKSGSSSDRPLPILNIRRLRKNWRSAPSPHMS